MKRKIVYLAVILSVLTGMFSTSMSAAESTSGSSGEVEFSIPANSFCDASQRIQISLNISNLSANAAGVTLNLFNENGDLLQTEGITTNGKKSTLTLGEQTSVASKKTAFYNATFGEDKETCDNVPYYGTISATSAQTGKVIASGWVKAENGNTPILINSGLSFATAVDAATPAPEPTTPAPSDTNIIPPMTSNTNGSITVSASSAYDGNFQPYKAFNGTLNDKQDAWATKLATITGWLKIDFGKATLVQKYIVANRIDASSKVTAPKTWTFEGSNDDTNWVTLDTRTDEMNWSNGEKRTYSFTNSKSYQYYRINVTANNGSADYTAIGELEMY